MRSAIKDMGWHGTGQVGFVIGTDILTDIATLDEFTLLEADSRLPIFRRSRTMTFIDKRLYLFDTTILIQRHLHNAITRHFNLSYFNAESIPLETLMTITSNKFTNSILMKGRSNLNRYSPLLNNAEFTRVALLRDPFIELAERLMCLNIVSRTAGTYSDSVGMHGLESLVPLANALSFDDPTSMAAVFRNATPEQRRALSDPMTRLYGCELNEDPRHRHVSVALENLAGMDLVGTHSQFEIFRKLLRGHLGLDIFDSQNPVQFETIATVAETLARVGPVVDLLENDILLYSWAEEAIANGLNHASV